MEVTKYLSSQIPCTAPVYDADSRCLSVYTICYQTYLYLVLKFIGIWELLSLALSVYLSNKKRRRNTPLTSTQGTIESTGGCEFSVYLAWLC